MLVDFGKPDIDSAIALTAADFCAQPRYTAGARYCVISFPDPESHALMVEILASQSVGRSSYFLCRVSEEQVKWSGSRKFDGQMLESFVAGCEHIIVSAYGDYEKLIWSKTGAALDASSLNYIRQDIPEVRPPVRMDLPRSTVHYFQQRLCDAPWYFWSTGLLQTLGERGQFWCMSPIRSDRYFTANLGAQFRQAYPLVGELALRTARKEAARRLAEYLESHPDTFLIVNGLAIWACESSPLLPGPSSDGAFRIVVDTGKRSMHNRETWSMSYVFKAIIGGTDTARCIEQSWRQESPNLHCAAAINLADKDSIIRSERILSKEELRDRLQPATTCLVLNAFRNDLPLFWTKETGLELASIEKHALMGRDSACPLCNVQQLN